MINEIKLENSIAIKLIKIVFIIYFIFILVITSIQLVFEFYHSKNLVISELESIELSTASSLENAIWLLDNQQVENISKGLLKLKIVTGITITDERRHPIISKGHQSNQSGTFSHAFTVTHQDSHYLARVKLYSNNSIVFERMENIIYSFMIAAVIKTLILWLLLFWAIKKNLLTPLTLLLQAIRNLNLSHSNNPQLSLHLHEKNEFKLIEIAFNKMLNMLQSQQREIVQHDQQLVNINASLESTVKKRTEQLEDTNKQLLNLANTDPLTNIHNRRSFFNIGQQLLALAKRNNQSLTVMMCDIDYFKKINDTYGHATGDEILIAFAKNIQALLRDSEVFARIGGEEFAIIVNNSNIRNSLILANRIHKSITTIKVLDEQQKNIHFTISIGLGIAEEHDTTIDNALQRADEKLYHAKENGRNRTSH